MNPDVAIPKVELHAAALLAAVALGLSLLCAFLYRRYRKPYLGWWALAWGLYLLRIGAIASFLATRSFSWLYWHQVLTGWTALTLLWAALVFSRQVEWRWAYAAWWAFPLVWSYVAIYHLQDFLLAAGPAVLFLSLVTVWTGWVFWQHYLRVRVAGAALLSAAFLLWGVHHLDYPFLRARGAWSPWGYYLDILFLLATAAGILVLVQDELQRGLDALAALSADLPPAPSEAVVLEALLQRPLALPAALGSAMVVLDGDAPRTIGGAGACAGWESLAVPPRAAAAVRTAIRDDRPCFVRDWPDARGTATRAFPYGAVLPVPRGGTGWGALVVVGNARDPFTALDAGFLRALGAHIGAALERADLYRRLEARTAELGLLSARTVEQHEAERRRLSLELHDETAQVFTAVKLQLGLLRERVDAGLATRLEHIEALIDAGMRGIRRVTEQLRPSLLDDLGLVPALRSLADGFGDRCDVTVELETPAHLPALSDQAELALFRAMQEALANVARHAGARRVWARLSNGGSELALEIRDDGCGLPPGFDLAAAERAGHLGLAGMRERITALGGRFVIARADGAGVTLRVTLPVAGGVDT